MDNRLFEYTKAEIDDFNKMYLRMHECGENLVAQLEDIREELEVYEGMGDSVKNSDAIIADLNSKRTKLERDLNDVTLSYESYVRAKQHEIQYKRFEENVPQTNSAILMDASERIPKIIERNYANGFLVKTEETINAANALAQEQQRKHGIALLQSTEDESKPVFTMEREIFTHLAPVIQLYYDHLAQIDGDLEKLKIVIEASIAFAVENRAKATEANPDLNTQALEVYEKESEEIPYVQGCNVPRYLMPNHKVINELQNQRDWPSKMPMRFDVRQPYGKNGTNTICEIQFNNPNIKILGSRPFTEFDRSVFCAVSTLWDELDTPKTFTPEMVYRTMVNDTEARWISPQMLDDIIASIDKQRFMMIVIHAKSELQYSKKYKDRSAPSDVEATFEGYLLPAEKVTVAVSGVKKSGYKIIKKPILYDYSQNYNQVYSLDPELLKTYEVKNQKLQSRTSKAGDKRLAEVPNTKSRIEIKHYLLRQIEWMQSETKKRSNVILLDTIYKNLLEHPTAKTKRTMRENVEKCLDSWKATGDIIDYQPKRKSRAIVGYTIML